MKSLTLSKISFVFGLVLGIMVLWAGATPAMVGGNSFIGGWVPVPDCSPCSYTTQASCDDGQPTCNPWGTTNICAGEDEGVCQPSGELDECSGGICEETHDTECSSDPV